VLKRRNMSGGVVAEDLIKTYPRKRGNSEVKALDGLSLTVPEGTVLGVLGPNGAGKTTCVRILATLLKPDSGHATVAGIDVVAEPKRVREVIGLSGQYAAVDEQLTGRQNLVMFGRLYQLGKRGAQARTIELLERFDLTDAADRQIKTYSGGMRRRLDLAASLVARPKVLFLDEPTTGLDPRARLEMWDVIDELVKGGTTLLLTTQYLEEADKLADQIAVIDHGRVIERGTADELKSRIGGERLDVTVADHQLDSAARILAGMLQATPTIDRHARKVSVPVAGGTQILLDVVRALDSGGVAISDLSFHRPTLDDVFMTLTGRSVEVEDVVAATAGRRGR
jgi:ABC-2 type transport system ATP-binding protein